MRYLISMFLLLLLSSNTNAQSQKISWDRDVYSKTILKWTSALKETASVSSTTYIKKLSGGKDKLHNAKHRDVIYWIPRTTDLSKDFVVLLWFHGHNGFVKKRTFQNRTLKQLVPKAKQGKNFVLILPEMPWSVHGKTPTRRNGQIWENPGDFLIFIEDSLEVLKNHAGTEIGDPDFRIVGHSAGGSTIATIGFTEDLCHIQPSRIVWSDSTYGRWLEKANDKCLQMFPSDVFINGHKSTATSPRRFTKTYKGRNVRIHLKRLTHKQIGDNIVKLSGVLD